MMERITYSEKDFDVIRNVMLENAGISLGLGKQELVYSRLVKRVRTLGLKTFRDYCHVLKSDRDERSHCVNAMTTNVTSFFRENHHFDYLKRVVLPGIEAINQHSPRPTLRIWSAGCSSGEEPYSIAMTIDEHFVDKENWAIRIDATDLDSNILLKAKQGVYRRNDIDALSKQHLKPYFQKGKGENAGLARIVPELKEYVSFSCLNLKEPWPVQEQYDLVFCRNVMIYFDVEFRRQIINQFSQVIKPGGYLFVGHSESLFGLSEDFEIVGKTIHRKRLRHDS